MSPRLAGGLVILAGVAFFWFGLDHAGQLVAVGAMYLILGGGVVASTMTNRGRVTFRRVVWLDVFALGIAFICVLGWTLSTATAAATLTLGRIADQVTLAMQTYLPVLPVGAWFTFGGAVRPSERQYAGTALGLAVAFVSLVELLDGYTGLSSLLFSTLLIIIVLLGVLVLGVPLYLLGMILTDGEHADVTTGDGP